MRLRAGPMLRSRESVSDLAQSVCREILTDAGRFREDGGADGFRKWLFSTAIRKLSDRQAFWQAHKRDHRRLQRDDAASTGVSEQYRTFLTPSRVASIREDALRVEAAFDRLPDHYREVITLVRFGGLSHSEVAEMIGSNPTACRALLHRALARLAEELDEPPIT